MIDIPAEVQGILPKGAKIGVKEGLVWGLIAKFLSLLGNKNFMERFVTTIGKTVYLPAGWVKNDKLNESIVDMDIFKSLLVHEGVHIKQTIAAGLGFYPLGFLVYGLAYLLLPLPVGLAYFRYRIERAAYVVGMNHEIEHGVITTQEQLDREIEFVVGNLSGGGYGYAWPFKNSIRNYLTKRISLKKV